MTEKYLNKKHQVSKFQDCIIVEGIACYALIGVADNERAIGQNLRIDLEVYADLRQAGESDLLSDTVSYVALSQKVQSAVQEKDYHLLEHLASSICKEVFQDFSSIDAVGIRVCKPHIPSRDFKGEASVYIFRERNP